MTKTTKSKLSYQCRKVLKQLGDCQPGKGLVVAPDANRVVGTLKRMGLAETMLVGVYGIHVSTLQESWANIFGGGGKRRIFDALLKRKHGLERADLAKAASLEASSGTYGKYLSQVRKKGILVEGFGKIALHRALWLEW